MVNNPGWIEGLYSEGGVAVKVLVALDNNFRQIINLNRLKGSTNIYV